MKTVLLVTAAALQFLSAAPAAACPGPHAEKYLLWFRQPTLLAGEVAIEIDLSDFKQNIKRRELQLPSYKVKRVVSGAYEGETIEVQRSGSTCEREAASGIFDQLILVGTITQTASGALRLVPRYMSYDDPIRFEAGRSLDEYRNRN